MSKKILVTGGTGYIGSHTVVELQQSGYDVVVIDNLSNSTARIIDQIGRITGKKPRFYEMDLCNEAALRVFFKENQDLAGIIHFAAYKAVGESVEFPLKYYHNNLVSLILLLRFMETFHVPNIVFSSSCTVYGQPDELPVTELAPVKEAFSPYGNTKQISEEIIKDTVKTMPLRAISLRYFNPIGAHRSGLIGELPIGIPNNLVPFITQTAIGKREKLMVFGDDYDTSDGTAIRDYIHVVDLAKAHVVAVERMLHNENEKNFEVFNLGTGKGTSVMEAIQAFEKVTGMRLNYEITGRRSGDVPRVWADTTLANLKLCWKAQMGLEEMMASAWQWEKNLAAGILES
ncbi:MAG: UDP-glucose 4-epimerase GalE [Bacteroides sp.]|jgi:UDP-glucose 4-epimerase|nr:UDP-glucose 4-epimerase GalE [Bacteroides sp.]